MPIIIKLTKHAAAKLEQRLIPMEDLKATILNPEHEEEDRFDSSLTHFIGKVQGKFLRVIARRESNEQVLVISAFFDRRLSRRKND